MLTESERFEEWSEKQNRFMSGEASAYPMGYGFYLYSSLPVKKVVCVLKNPQDLKEVEYPLRLGVSDNEQPGLSSRE